MKRLISVVLAVVMLATIGGVAVAANYQDTGNGGMSGPHYTLNILAKDKKMNIEDCGQGHRIFVPLGEDVQFKNKLSLINLTQGAAGEFRVEDCDATDDDEAEFVLPNPAAVGDCTAYTVFIRALGKPGGKADMGTCAEQCVEYNPALPPTDPNWCEVWAEVCSIEVLNLERTRGKQKFENVSKELLTICAEICVDWNEEGECIETDWVRLYLFDDRLEGYLWKYDNKGLRHAQLRFYETPTCYPIETNGKTKTWDCVEPA
jgi:hypothetical protein